MQAGYKVLGIDKFTYASNPDTIRKFSTHMNFSFFQEDIAKLKHLPDCDYVINVAAESHVGNSIVDSEDFINSNIVGVKNLLDLIRNKQANTCDRPVFFHFSTDEVYGDIEEGAHVETDILKPSNPYSASKASADMLVQAWARTYGLEYIILRPTNNYGIGQYPEKLIPISVKLLSRGKKIRLHNQGHPIRNWLHSDDTARAVIDIIEAGVTNEIFNVAGGFEQPNINTVKKVCECYFGEKRDWTEYLDLTHVREGQDVRYALNDDKLRALGWKPERMFDNEIQRIVDHYKKNFTW